MRGWVLHRRTWLRRKFLYELFLEGLGRVAAIGPQGKSPATAVQALNPVTVQVSGAGELLRLHSCEPSQDMTVHGLALLYGVAANEAIVRLIPRLGGEDLFSWYSQALTELAGPWHDRTSLQHWIADFRIDLLRRLGYGTHASTDIHGEPLQLQTNYVWLVDGGWQSVSAPSLGRLSMKGAWIERMNNKKNALEAGEVSARTEFSEKLIATQAGARMLSNTLLRTDKMRK